ncbi:hypothetical protein AUR64_06430 [Haloprofundus marisrubri]|uniref:MarR family transcriptional regulator n=1 Tax=Haloprofundus marisrubri TaxID=1514971 RepID=A0A0W1RCD8_9EURY|nr:DUF6432 family protein [Haloprofundus marisrubri]KTG11050.1 hypothetical protein AUR64_06430 [Haloprofundus marisrubri]
MRAKREYRNRGDVDVAVLDALVDRADDGMTVLELRAAVDADIDTLESALADLKADSLITVDQTDERVVIMPADRVVPDADETVEADQSLFDSVRDRLGL